MLPRWFARLPLPGPLKHFAGSAWLMAGRLFAMGSVAAFGLATYVGLMSAIDSVGASRDQAHAASHLADLELRVVTDDVANMPDFRSLPGVADARLRMVFPGHAELGGRSLSILTLAEAAPSREPINTQQLVDGQDLDPQDPQGVLIERALARYHGLGPGSALRLRLGKETLDLHVRGVVSDGEFLLAPANPALFVPAKGSLGIVYAPARLFSERYGFMPANSVLLRAAPGVDLQDLRQRAIERAQTRLNVEGSALRHEQFSHQFLEKNLGVFRIIVPVIVLVSVLCAAIVTSFLFAQWLQAERQSLALLLVLGHRPRWLGLSFGAMALYLALGVVLGGLPGAWWVGQGFLDNFAGALGMPPPTLAVQARHVLTGIAGVLAVFLLSGLLAWRRMSALAPREAMRRAPDGDGAPGALGAWLGRHLPGSALRMAVRALLRHGSTSATTIVATALGFGLTSAFFIGYSSFIGTSVAMVEANRWDLAVDFQAPMWPEDLARLRQRVLPAQAEVSPYSKTLAQALSADGLRRANLYAGGFDARQAWHAARLTEGQALDDGDVRGILIEDGTARTLGLKPGSPVTLEILGKRWTARVRGLFSSGLPGEARMTLAFSQEIGELDGRVTGLFIRMAGADTQALLRALRADPDVRQVLTRDEVTHEILEASGQISTLIRMGSMLSIAIAVLFVLASTGYAVMRQAPELQALRLLGFRDARVRLLIALQIALLGLLALLLSLPIGQGVAQLLLERLSQSWFRVDPVLRLSDILQSAALGALLLPLVAWPLARTVLRIPLAAELRTRDTA